MCIRDSHTVLITRHITWQRVSPTPPAPAPMHDSLSTEEGGSEADDESMSYRGGGGLDELDDGLARLDDLDVTWGVDLDAFCRSAHSRHLPRAMLATGQPRRWVRLKEVRWTPPRPRQGRPKQSRRWVRLKGAWTPPRSRQGGPKVTRAHQQPPAPTKGTAKIPPRSCRGGQQRTQQLETAPRDSKGPDPGSESTPGGRTC